MTRQRVPVDGAELAVLVQGSGEPVVFIHGGVIADELAAVAGEPALADRYQTLRYHRRGYGASTGGDLTASIESDAADCQALLTALGIRAAHLVGKSYGGVVALQVAADATETVHTLALLEPALLVVPSAVGFAEAATPIVGRYMSGDSAGAIDDFMALVWGREWRANLEQRVPGGGEQAEKDAMTVFESDLPALRDWRFEAGDARSITQPMLYLGGTESGPLFDDIRNLVRSWFPHAQDKVLTGANHSFPITHPMEVAISLATFFARHPLPA